MNMDFWMQTYIIALPIFLTSAMGYVVWNLKEQKKDRDANRRGTMLLLRVQLIEYHDKYVKLGEIPSYAYQNFVEMYEAYHELGGNGMATKIMNYIKPELIVVAIALYILGIGIKKTESIKDKYIPAILGALGIVLCAIWVMANSPLGNAQEIMMAVFTSIIQGILVAGLSTYVNQLIKQGTSGE